jgi:hypothetical protein
MLCLWRWSIPAAIPRINRILCSSFNFTFESYNNLSKLPNQSKFERLWEKYFYNQMQSCDKCLWFDLIRINHTSRTIFHDNDRLRTIQWNSKQMNNIWMWR